MSLLDLSGVTRVLIRLVQEAVTVSPAWDGTTPTVSPLPPDKLSEEGDVLGLYLYHISEDPHFRNTPASGAGPTPVALAPMGLVLHYQLTAHTTASPELPQGTYRGQLLFGLALKALHDHPTIVDSTVVNGVPLLATFGLDGRDNRFRSSLRTTPVEDALTYWTAGQSPARLAAYYQVSVVLLEPERPPTRVSPVLDRSVTVFPGAPPHLASSGSQIVVTPPGAPGPRAITASPAQVPIGGRFTLHGSDLSGESTDLALEGEGWDAAETVDPITWAVMVTSSELSATVGAVAGARDVVPGLYSVTARVSRQVGSGATAREIAQSSNRSAIVVTPTFADPAATAAGALVTLTGSLFQHPDIPTDPDDDRALQVILGATTLALDGDGSLDPGEFEVTDPSTVTLRVPADVDAGFLPLRVRVNGAESPPRWLEIV